MAGAYGAIVFLGIILVITILYFSYLLIQKLFSENIKLANEIYSEIKKAKSCQK